MRKILILLLAFTFMSSTYYPFCDGWEDGYQQALEDCFEIALTPLCPLEPINSNGYKTGFGMGYAQAKKDHCDK